MNGTQVLVGLILIGGSLLGFRNEALILSETGYGRAIRRWCGEAYARPVFRVLLLLLAAVGGALATNLLKPIQW